MISKIFPIVAVLFLSSCCIQGKMDEARRVVKNAKDTLQVEAQNLSNTNKLSQTKITDGKIDSIVLALVNKRLSRFQPAMDVTTMNISSVESLLTDVKAFRKKYKTIIAPTLDSLRKSTAAYQQKAALYEMISDGLNIADYKLFDLAAFFGPGKYSVPDEKKESASISFGPIVDSIIQFSNKYKDIPRTGSLIILGFADGTGFSEGPLYSFLAEKIGIKEPSKEQLNQKLSELRAEELISLLSDQFKKKAVQMQNAQTLKVDYLRQGKGENLPLPTIKDYQVNDDRRRIVLCYWTILPD
jgi:hypothetical protein